VCLTAVLNRSELVRIVNRIQELIADSIAVEKEY
jgi:hypothetical protein